MKLCFINAQKSNVIIIIEKEKDANSVLFISVLRYFAV